MNFTDLIALPLLFGVSITPVTPLTPANFSVPWITDVELSQPTGCSNASNGQPYYGPAC